MSKANLDLFAILAEAERYRITYKNNIYDIDDRETDLNASVEKDGTVKYFIRGVYNSGSDYAEIDIESLQAMQTFIELLSQNNLLKKGE